MVWPERIELSPALSQREMLPLHHGHRVGTGGTNRTHPVRFGAELASLGTFARLVLRKGIEPFSGA